MSFPRPSSVFLDPPPRCLAVLAITLLLSVPPARAAEEPKEAAAPAPASETLATRQLRDVVARERAIWERLRAQPDDPAVRQRADAEFRDVLIAYENVLRASPDFAEAFAAYGLLLSRTGNREDATRAFLKANQHNPNIPLVKHQLGNVLFEDGDYKAALPYYLMAIELEGNEPLYHYSLGSLLREYREFFVADGIYDRATIDAKMLAAFRRAAELAPENWGYIYRFAESYYDLDQPDWPGALAAWESLEKKARPGIEQQTLLLHRANVLLKMNRPDEAVALLDGVTQAVLQDNKRKLLDEAHAPAPDGS